MGGMDCRTSKKGEYISEHIVTDALRRSTPSIIWYLVFQHYINLSMDSSDESAGTEVADRPFSNPPNGAYPRIGDAAAQYRDGAADVHARGVVQEAEADTSSSDLQPWTYRSSPENDPCPTQKTLLGELLRLRDCRRDPNDPACADRIARLRASINEYEEEERAMAWNHNRGQARGLSVLRPL